MKKVMSVLFILCMTIPVFGNDGVYNTRGGVIYPTKESKISLEKETLSFTVRDKICRVDISFEFNNPESVERKLTIGFQAPTAVGDVSDKISNTNQITDFKILSNGQTLPFKVKAAESENGELKEPNEIHFTQLKQGVFVYLFELSFKPGVNKIHHSYSFPASSNVLFSQFYNYILTTGAKWSGGKINNLTILFDMGDKSSFYVNDVFGKDASWSIIGSGEVTKESFRNYETDAKIVKVNSGKLQIKVSDLQPKRNIEFGVRVAKAAQKK
ncbi:MAG: DUF4424 family protein [Bacteroidales bacterium]|nr:DUF4424 family protein [Bacteroidales bacterium]